MSSTGALRVGLAGLGPMGRNHLRSLLGRDDITLVAVADPLEQARSEAATLVGAAARQAPRHYLDAADMLADCPLDAVIVATPTSTHQRLGLAALDAGVATLVEKPIAATVDEATSLADAALSLGVPLQVGHIERFNPALRELRRQLQDGTHGRLLSIATTRWGRPPTRAPEEGVAMDLATHDLDLICHLVGERPVRAYAETRRTVHTQHEDVLNGLLAFSSGLIGLLDVNRVASDRRRRVVVFAEAGLYEVDCLQQTLHFSRREPPTERVELPVTRAEPLHAEHDAFFDAARTGSQPWVGGADGVLAVVLADALLRSSASNQAVAIEP